MFVAGILHGVETGDRATDAVHPVIEESPHRGGPPPHYVPDKTRF